MLVDCLGGLLSDEKLGHSSQVARQYIHAEAANFLGIVGVEVVGLQAPVYHLVEEGLVVLEMVDEVRHRTLNLRDELVDGRFGEQLVEGEGVVLQQLLEGGDILFRHIHCSVQDSQRYNYRLERLNKTPSSPPSFNLPRPAGTHWQLPPTLPPLAYQETAIRVAYKITLPYKCN